MDWETIKSIGFGVISVFTIISSALVGILFGSLKTLRDTANDLRARVVDLETERTEDKKTIGEKGAENDILRSMVTGKVEWVALTDQLEEHHRQALKQWLKQDTELSELPAAVHDAVQQALEAVVPLIMSELEKAQKSNGS